VAARRLPQCDLLEVSKAAYCQAREAAPRAPFTTRRVGGPYNDPVISQLIVGNAWVRSGPRRTPTEENKIAVSGRRPGGRPLKRKDNQ
jgi:hypothetical protein